MLSSVPEKNNPYKYLLAISSGIFFEAKSDSTFEKKSFTQKGTRNLYLPMSYNVLTSIITKSSLTS